MQSLLEKCYAKNEEDPNNFAECVLQGQNKMSELMQKFQLKSIYLKKTAKVCLENKKDPKICEGEVIKVGKKLVGTVIEEI